MTIASFTATLRSYARVPLRVRSNGAAALIPAAVGSAGVGAIAAKAPAAGAGVGLQAALALLPWAPLFLLFVAAAAVNVRFRILGFNLQPAHLFVLPLAAKAVVHGWGSRQRLSWAEWAIAGFVGVHVLSSILKAANPGESLGDAALLGMGALAFLATSMSISTPRRLFFAGRVFLFVALAASAIALAALAAHHLLGTSFGVSGRDPGLGVSTAGLAKEHNILGSFSAAAALSFLVLALGFNPLVSRRTAILGFLVCSTAMLASLTRGAWVGFAVSLVFLFLFVAPRIRRPQDRDRALPLRLVGVLAVLGLFLLVSPAASESPPPGPRAGLPAQVAFQAAHILDPQSATAETRLAQWHVALDDASTSPWIGLGTNSFGQRRLGAKSGEPGYVGNLYIRNLHDSGVLGSVFLLVFLVTMLWPMNLSPRSGPSAMVALAFTFGGIVTAVSYAWTDASLQIWPWIALGIVRGGRRLVRVQSDAP